MPAGYSGTPLAKKLGIKERSTVFAINAPDDYPTLLHPLPDQAGITYEPAVDVDLIHIFTNSRAELQKSLSSAVRQIKQDGAIWVSWYKKATKLPTEITEDTVREAAFPLGLVDIKV